MRFKIIIFFVFIFSIFILSSCNQPINEEYRNNLNLSSLNRVGECFNESNMIDSLIYIYDDSCPACSQMNPIVNNLINEGYNIIKVNAVTDRTNLNTVMDCSINQPSSVPSYICPIDGELNSGVISERELENMIERCFN